MDQVASTGTEQMRDMPQVVRASMLPSDGETFDGRGPRALYALDTEADHSGFK